MGQMKVHDLGRLDGPVLLYGGPYSNLQATQALLQMADVVGIPPARRICTGDVVAYCADPVATAELVLDQGGALVAGNCERQLAEGAADCGCGFEDGTTCDVLSKGWYPHALRQIAARSDLQAAFAAAPDIVTFTHAGRHFGVIHGGVSDIARFLWSTSPEAELAHEIALIEAAVGAIDGVIAGHSGIAFTRQIGRYTWINAGVVGMPPNDGTQKGAFVILDQGEVRHQRLIYDAREAAAAMTSAGLTQGYETALTTGVWPSQDILPDALKRSFA